MIRRATFVSIAAVVLVATAAAAQTPPRLSLTEAESRALQENPRIRAGEYSAKAAGETTRELRSAYFPTLLGSVTGVESVEGTRIAAGGLNNPSVFDRFAYGVAGSQLITDFGRTGDLVASARLRERSQQQDVVNRRAGVLLDVDRAYLNALRAAAVERIARQTVSARQVIVDQVTALMNSGLRSSLDLSFVKVNLGEAQLLLVQAQNDVQASFAALSEVLGDPRPTVYALDDQPNPPPLPVNADPLIAQALRDRPDVSRERFTEESLSKLADAERDLSLPTVSAVGVAGMTPYHESTFADHYAAAGVNVSVPVFNGGLFAARRSEANFRALAQRQVVQEVEHGIARDVEIAWLDARTAFQRLTLTGDMLAQTTDAVTLAQQRYDLGLSSIVELTQAQLNQTRAQIDEASARYEYQSRIAALSFQTGERK
jgi:outer membrane protein